MFSSSSLRVSEQQESCFVQGKFKYLPQKEFFPGSSLLCIIMRENNTQSITMSSREGVVTRARKRKLGQRDSLWDVVVKWDDICFKHILPRLDLNDVKILVRGEYGDESFD